MEGEVSRPACAVTAVPRGPGSPQDGINTAGSPGERCHPGRGWDSLVWGDLREFSPKKDPQQAMGSVESGVPRLCPCSDKPLVMAGASAAGQATAPSSPAVPPRAFVHEDFLPKDFPCPWEGIQQDAAAPSPPTSGKAHPGGRG